MAGNRAKSLFLAQFPDHSPYSFLHSLILKLVSSNGIAHGPSMSPSSTTCIIFPQPTKTSTLQTESLPTASTLSSQFSSVQSLSHVQLCDSMDCSMPGLPVHCQIPEFTQTHVHRVSNTIQPSHPLLSLSPSAFIFPSIRIFSNESALHIRWPKDWSFSFNISPSNEYSGLISFRKDWLDLLAVQGTLKSLLQHQKHQFSGAQLSAFSSSCNKGPQLLSLHAGAHALASKDVTSLLPPLISPHFLYAGYSL